MAKINKNLNVFVVFSILCLKQILASDSTPSQIRINDSFTISANHSTETLTTIINDLEQSEDSGIVNGAFYIQSVNFSLIKVFFNPKFKKFNETFDLFFIPTDNYTHMICYQKMLLTKNFSQSCTFEIKKNLNNYTLDLVNATINEWASNSTLIVIDNTPFPIDGANGNQELTIESTFIIDITPSNTYYVWTEISQT